MPSIAKPSVLSLFVQMQFSGQQLASGTGFVAQARSGPVLITNRHNVTGRNQNTGRPLSATGGIPNELAITHNRKNRTGQWVTRVEPLFLEANPRWIEHPVLGGRADIVALPLTQLEDVELLAYDLQPTQPGLLVGPADTVSVIGFPFGLGTDGFAIWATGTLASEPHVDYEALPVQLIDCRTRQGQSGSPVIAYRKDCWISLDNHTSQLLNGEAWRFIGLYSGRVNDESDLGLVWKAPAIQELISHM